MADDNCDDHEHEHFAFRVPAALGDALSSEHDKHRMRAQVLVSEIHEFLDGLNVPQLLALRRILCMDNDSATNNFFDGQCMTLLRVVHNVNPDTGKRFDTSELDDVPTTTG